MKIISKTETGVLVDMPLDELAHILDKSKANDAGLMMQVSSGGYGYTWALNAEKFIGKTINLADIWKKMHDHIRLESSLAAMKIELSKMLDYCERAKPIADEVAEIVKPKKAA